MKNLKEFKPLIKLIGKEKKALIISSILIFIHGLSEIATGYLNGSAVEAITKMQLKLSLTYLLIYFCLEFFVDGYMIHKANSILYKVESLLSRRLCFHTYKKSLNLPAVAFEKKSSGEIINRITNDADSLSFTFRKILSMFSSLIASLIIIVYIFINSWIVGLEIIIFVGLLFLIIRIYNPKLKKIHKERKESQDKFTALTTESIRGIREIKTLGIKNNLITNCLDIIKLIYKKSEDEIDIQKEFNILTRFVKSILEVGTFILCAILLYKGRISLTFFIAMTYYVYRYLWLIEEINDLTQTYQKTIVSIERVNEILENKLYKDVEFGNKKLTSINGTVEFKNVSFAYPDEEPTLNNFNLKIEPNKKVAVIGKSGQGKSTLFNLLTRIFDIEKGNILIDGIEIKDLTEESLR